jgi:hypothetical protein
MSKNSKVIIFTSGGTLISQIEEAESADIGEPDCKLVQPFNIISDGTLQPWLGEMTIQNELPNPLLESRNCMMT